MNEINQFSVEGAPEASARVIHAQAKAVMAATD
jgi:hypothetical protein